jgi:hypothetical protein
MSETNETARSGLEGAVKGETQNYPGHGYVARVAAAISHAYSSQTEQMNEAWTDMRNGRWDFGRAMQVWARTIETSYDVFVAAAQVPVRSPSPAWLVVPYYLDKPKANRPADWLYHVPVEGQSETGLLDYSKFIGATAAYDLYREPPVRSGTRVEFRLNESELKLLKPDTDYISFVFRKGQGAAPPLAIIVLRVRRGDPLGSNALSAP